MKRISARAISLGIDLRNSVPERGKPWQFKHLTHQPYLSPSPTAGNIPFTESLRPRSRSKSYLFSS